MTVQLSYNTLNQYANYRDFISHNENIIKTSLFSLCDISDFNKDEIILTYRKNLYYLEKGKVKSYMFDDASKADHSKIKLTMRRELLTQPPKDYVVEKYQVTHH